MTKVFVRVSYGVIEMPGMFKALCDFIGDHHIEQTNIQGIGPNRSLDIWFYTDAVTINEGQTRQVEITCKDNDGVYSFELSNYGS